MLYGNWRVAVLLVFLAMRIVSKWSAILTLATRGLTLWMACDPHVVLTEQCFAMAAALESKDGRCDSMGLRMPALITMR